MTVAVSSVHGKSTPVASREVVPAAKIPSHSELGHQNRPKTPVFQTPAARFPNHGENKKFPRSRSPDELLPGVLGNMLHDLPLSGSHDREPNSE